MTKGDIIAIEKPSLAMECEVDDLTEDQKIFYAKKLEEHQALREKLNNLIVSNGGQELYTGKYLTAYQVVGAPPDFDALNAKELEKYAPAPPKLKIPKGYVPKKQRADTPEPVADDPPPPEEDDDDEDFVPLAKRKAAIKKTKAKERKEEKAEKPDKKVVANVRPTENSAVGGLSVGSSDSKKKEPSAVVDLTKDDGKPAADSREVNFRTDCGMT